MNIKRIFFLIGSFGVLMGAFGAHYLKSKINAIHQQTWNTATSYLFIHVLIGIYSTHIVRRKRSSYFFLGGILLFSGSLYLIAIFNISLLGLMTPVGGVLFILGWLFLVLDSV